MMMIVYNNCRNRWFEKKKKYLFTMVNLLDVYISIIIKVFIKIVSLDIAKKVDVYYDYLFLVYSFIHSLSFRYCYVF